jgi:hypothetical protein
MEQHQGHGHSAQVDLPVPDFRDVNICKSTIQYFLFLIISKLTLNFFFFFFFFSDEIMDRKM